MTQVIINKFACENCGRDTQTTSILVWETMRFLCSICLAELCEILQARVIDTEKQRDLWKLKCDEYDNFAQEELLKQAEKKAKTQAAKFLRKAKNDIP